MTTERLGYNEMKIEGSSYANNSGDIPGENAFQRLPSDEASSASDGGQANMETSDDILEKYRVKSRSQPSTSSPGLSNSNEVILGSRPDDSNSSAIENCDSVFQDRVHAGINENLSMEDDEDMESASTAARRITNIEDTFAFQDAKRKLRLMLAEADICLLSTLPPSRTRPSLPNGLDHTPKNPLNSRENDSRMLSLDINNETPSKDNDLIWFLRVQLAEALNLQDRNLVARLYETLRCVQAFDKQYDYDVDDIDGERSS